MPSKESRNIASDISVLYELSLAVGQSLDLKSNCENFLRTVMARKALGYGSVWVRRKHLATAEEGEGEDLVLVYSHPQFRVREKALPPSHPILARLKDGEAFSLASSDKGFADMVTENQIERGVFAVYALGQMGVLKLFSATRETAFTEEELNQLKNVMGKFTISLEGCLAHETLVREAAERQQAQLALQQSEEKYRNVVERANDGIVILQDARIVYVNGRLAKMAGYAPEEMIGTPFTNYVHPDEMRALAENYQRRIAGKDVKPVYDTVLVNRQGARIFAELNAGLIAYQGRPADLIIIRDIGERKNAEVEHTRLAMAVEQTTDAVIITNTLGAIQYVNPAFERISGYSRAEVLGKNPKILKSDRQDPSAFREMWGAISKGRAWRGRLVNRKKDGSTFVCDVIITPTRNESGDVINFVSVQRDVTRELQMEEQYLQAQKMESIGRLAGGIAHDFNNIMTAVLGFGSMILDQLSDGHPMRHAVEQIVSAGERATNLTRQLLTFSRRQVTEVKILDLNAVIMDMYQLLRRALGEDVELITQFDEHNGSVKADVGLMQQVVMNLAINARDAMPQGGQLKISTSHRALDQRFCQSRVGLKPGDYVLLSLRDTGVGMSKEVLAHVFEPFFTTKPKGQGTGLGLATVYGIVQQCGGHIEIESEVGRGTEVKVWLPRIEPSEETIPVELEEKAQKGTETILVVEDEDLVRDLTVHILKSLGYRVIEAKNGREALEIVRADRMPIDLVLTDVVMPQMGGPEMAQQLLKLKPKTRVLFTSGFAENVFMERGMVVPHTDLIQKPYTREILAQRIRQALERKP